MMAPAVTRTAWQLNRTSHSEGTYCRTRVRCVEMYLGDPDDRVDYKNKFQGKKLHIVDANLFCYLQQEHFKTSCLYLVVTKIYICPKMS